MSTSSSTKYPFDRLQACQIGARHSTETQHGREFSEDGFLSAVAEIMTAAGHEQMRQDLSDARTGWEQATEAVREAEEVLAKERALRVLLAEALHNLEVSANSLQYCFDQRPENFGTALTQLAADAERARTALAAAEAA